MTGTAVWLEEALQAERDFLFEVIERRHMVLLSQFEQESKRLHGTWPKLVSHGTDDSFWSKQSDQNDYADDSVVHQQEDTKATYSPGTRQSKASESTASASKRFQYLKVSKTTGSFFRSLKSRENIGAKSKSEVLRSAVKSDYFDIIFSLAIFANFVVMIFESQYKGTETGYRLGTVGVDRSAGDTFPGAAAWWQALDWFFGVVFTVELLIKLAALRREYPRSGWNIFDALVVTLWWIDRAGASIPIPPMLLRVARMAKLLRMLRLVRTVQSFDSLFILTYSLRASIAATWWSLLFLVTVEALTGVSLYYMLETYINDATQPLDKRTAVYTYFGTFTRTILTMFELTLANWVVPTRVVVEHVSEWYMLPFLLHKLVIGFAAMSVLAGVFLHQTFHVAAQDNEAMVRTETITVQQHSDKIEKLFKHADTSGDGFLDENEFKTVVSKAEIGTWLSAMGLRIEDGHEAFRLLQGSGKKLTARELVAGTARLKGNARAIDLASTKRTVDKLETKVNWLCNILLDPGTLVALKESRPLMAPDGTDDAAYRL